MSFISNLIPSIANLIKAIPIYTILFMTYLEISPSLGNIWYRVASDNKKYINLAVLTEFIYKPFNYSFFWRPQYWDLNIYIGLYITSMLISLLHKAFTYNNSFINEIKER